MSESPPLPLHLPAGSGQVLCLLGLETTVKITAAQSGGALLLAEQSVTPGLGVPPHVHTREDEVFFVLDGEIEFTLGDRTVIGRAGDIIQAPRDVPHGYRGIGDRPARAYFMVMPAALESMFLEMAGWPADAPPDPAKLAELCGRYGITFL